MKNYETLRVTLQDQVAHVELNRPTRLNAINALMKAELHHVFDRIDADEGIGAVVVSGAGRAFSSGMELKDDAAGSTDGEATWRQALAGDLAVITRFWDCPKPTIAAIHGFCLAAACELSMA